MVAKKEVKQPGLKELTPYLHNMKEYWVIRNQIITRLANTLPGDRSDPSYIKLFTMKLLEKTGGNEKMKLLLQNAVNNYNYDNNVIDHDGRVLMEKYSLKWKLHLQKLLDKTFDKVVTEMKAANSKKEDRKSSNICVFSAETQLNYFNRIKSNNQERLTRIHFVYFPVPNLKLIKNLFYELNTSQFNHLGSTIDENFLIEREKECETLLSEDSAPFDYLNFMKFGLPQGNRYKFYLGYIKNFPITDSGSSKSHLSKSDSKVFSEIFNDDIDLSLKSCTFFPFEEMMYSLKDFQLKETKEQVEASGDEEDENQFGLPCGIIPMKNFAKFFGIVCYFAKKEEKVYSIFRHMYKFHFSKLLQIDPKSTENLIALGTIFERLFQRSMNQLYIHLRKLDVFPLDIAIEWMSCFFIGYLEIDQCFFLIDRIMGFDTLHILPILALGVFKYYEKALLKINDKQGAVDAVNRINQLNFLEIINTYLYG